jgi:hypothetical protein
MTPQENQALQTLLSQLTQVKGITKDPQAEAMIADAVARQPDAAYLLVQRSMILEQALDAAKAQISDLQRQLQHAQPQDTDKSFLDANSWGNTGGGAERSVTGAGMGAGMERSVTGAELPANMPKQNAVPAPNAVRAASPGFLGGGAGSMLGTMAATAAGVAGGAFLFQGIGNLLGNHPQQGASEQLANKEAAPANAAENDASAQNSDTASNDDMGSGDDATTDDLFASDSSFDDGSFDV